MSLVNQTFYANNADQGMRRYLTAPIIFCVVVGADCHLVFPRGFKIGAGGAAYQIEGGWNASGKGESIWDRYTHSRPWLVSDEGNGDIACDSYHEYKEDVRWVKEIGLDHYRFSISWTRLMPTGFLDKVNDEGVRYYHNLIDELLTNNIEPIVTIYHWDHPQVLEEMGGWTNELMVEWFAQYARLIFREFGTKVKIFSTINEPRTLCVDGYSSTTKAPGKAIYGGSQYLCGHNMLKAHAKAYHIYDREFRSQQRGQIGLAIPCRGFLPKNPDDDESADVAFQFDCGWIAHPIFKGDYPEVMKDRIATSSRQIGFARSLLPSFSEEWIKYIKGTADYFGLNHYTSRLVERREMGEKFDTFKDPTGVVESVDPTWVKGESEWLHIVPVGFGELLRKIKNEYDNPPVYILENGVSDPEISNDHQRVEYFHSYVKEMLTAINRDECNVQLFTVWSLLDNFEWERGYSEHFGLLSVNFSSPRRERKPKLSVSWWKRILRTRQLEPVVLGE